MIMLVSPLFQGCEKDDDPSTAVPEISYVRLTDPAKSDSLLVSAYLGNNIALMGNNLLEVKEIYFNDQEAIINTSYVTNSTIIITVPSTIPTVVTDSITMITYSGIKSQFPFKVLVPAPQVDALYCEYVAEGQDAVVLGDFFIDDPNKPLEVIFPGNIKGVVKSVSINSIVVTVPAGAGIGPISVKSLYGTTRSAFYFRDDRNIILNYNDLNSSGSWRSGTIKNDGNSLDQNYLMLKGEQDDNAGAEDYPGGGYVSELWGDANGRPEGNLLPGPINEYMFKFEANVIEWTGSYLNICWGPWAASVGGAQNQIYWSNLNARGLWRAWEETPNGSFKTNGWMTVTIPMADMKYNKDFGAMEFDINNCGSLTFWMKGPAATTGGKSKIEIYIDNVRIVHK